LQPADLVIAMTEQGEGLLGSSALIPEGGCFLHNQRIGLIENLDERRLEKSYLYRLINTPQVRKQIRSTASGTKVRHTAPKRIYSIKVKVPPVAVQRRISETLSAYDDLIENNQRRIALLEEAARLLYREWFVHFRFPGHEHVKLTDDLPDGWERQTLSGVVDAVKDTVKPEDFAENDIHIGLEHIPRRSFTLADWEPAENLASGKARFSEGDILFCKIPQSRLHSAVRSGVIRCDCLAGQE
jgi:type I restriction enzyme S subunit